MKPSYVEVMGTEQMLDLVRTLERADFDDIAIKRCGHEDPYLDFPEGAVESIWVEALQFEAVNVNLNRDCAACKAEYRYEQFAA